MAACGINVKENTDPEKDHTKESAAGHGTEAVSGKGKTGIMNESMHPGVNQAPIPAKITRVGTTVKVELTAQITDIEIAPDTIYKAWTFNGTVPGPIIRVKEGDTIELTLKNMDPMMPHSVDTHAVYASPDRDFANVDPGKTGTFTYTVGSPGVYMYHCGTAPLLMHIANGMYGTMIVEPKEGWPTDREIDREITLVQGEFYHDGSWEDMLAGQPEFVVFNGNAALKDKPFKAKAGEKIRLYFHNAGPNHVSSLHVVGSQFETVYVDGEPRNIQHGMQTVLVPTSGGVIVEFTVKFPGKYAVVTHQFNHATKGAMAIIEAE